MQRFQLAAFSIAGGAIATIAGLYAAAAEPLYHSFNIAWLIDTIICALLLGIGFAVGLIVAERPVKTRNEKGD